MATNRVSNASLDVSEGAAVDGQPAADAQADGAATAKAKSDKPRQTVPMMVMVPPAFKELIESKAKETNQAAGVYARKVLADALGYTLPILTIRQRGKYAHITDPEQRKAAIAADQTKQRDDVKVLLEGVRTGKINIEQLRAQLTNAGVATE